MSVKYRLKTLEIHCILDHPYLFLPNKPCTKHGCEPSWGDFLFDRDHHSWLSDLLTSFPNIFLYLPSSFDEASRLELILAFSRTKRAYRPIYQTAMRKDANTKTSLVAYSGVGTKEATRRTGKKEGMYSAFYGKIRCSHYGKDLTWGTTCRIRHCKIGFAKWKIFNWSVSGGMSCASACPGCSTSSKSPAHSTISHGES